MEGQKIYNFEERTLNFSKRILRLARELPASEPNIVLKRQFVRSATSVGANYREANDCLGDKDFIHRLRIARKEAKETVYWLELVMENNPQMKNRMSDLFKESVELKKILSKMISNRESETKNN